MTDLHIMRFPGESAVVLNLHRTEISSFDAEIADNSHESVGQYVKAYVRM